MPNRQRNAARRAYRDQIARRRTERVYEPPFLEDWEHPRTYRVFDDAHINPEHVVGDSFTPDGFEQLCVDSEGMPVWSDERGYTTHRTPWPSVRLHAAVLEAWNADKLNVFSALLDSDPIPPLSVVWDPGPAVMPQVVYNVAADSAYESFWGDTISWGGNGRYAYVVRDQQVMSRAMNLGSIS